MNRDFEKHYKKDVQQSRKNRLGSGITRTTYASKTFPDLVIKVENLDYGDRYFQNIMEYLTWEQVRYTIMAKYFAPCHWISPDGSVLYMSKTSPVQNRPKKVPLFLEDIHCGNFGKLNKRIVCHDYGITAIMKKGASKKTKKKFFW